jgi:hypothetical protein
MPEGVSQYPISKAIAEIMDDHGYSRVEFVRTLGYRNVENGLDRLNLWLDDGAGFDRILKQIISVYGHAEDISKAIEETKKVKKREHRESRRDVEDLCRRQYKPFIWVHTEDGAHSFLTAIAERQVKVLRMRKGFEDLSEPDKLKAVQTRIREHYQRTGGKYIGFGAILEYTYSNTFDTSIVLDVEGNVLDENGEEFLLPEVWLELYC